jgi:hypothetical protein
VNVNHENTRLDFDLLQADLQALADKHGVAVADDSGEVPGGPLPVIIEDLIGALAFAVARQRAEELKDDDRTDWLDEEFDGHLDATPPKRWSDEKRKACWQDTMAALKRIAATFKATADDVLPDSSHRCDRCNPGYICDGCAYQVNRQYAGGVGYQAGPLGPDNPGPRHDD